jgi:hypothetical protein
MGRVEFFFRIPLAKTVSHCWFLMKSYFPTASDNYLDHSKYDNPVSRGERDSGFRIEKANGTKINFSDRS